jgi:hypothetical protein
MDLPECLISADTVFADNASYFLTFLQTLHFYSPAKIAEIRTLMLPESVQRERISQLCTELMARQAYGPEEQTAINRWQWERIGDFMASVKPYAQKHPFWLFAGGSAVYNDAKKGDIDLLVATRNRDDILAADVYGPWIDDYNDRWHKHGPMLDINCINVEDLRDYHLMLTFGSQKLIRDYASSIDLAVFFTSFILNGQPVIRNGDIGDFRRETLGVLTLNPVFGALAINAIGQALQTRISRMRTGREQIV